MKKRNTLIALLTMVIAFALVSAAFGQGCGFLNKNGSGCPKALNGNGCPKMANGDFGAGCPKAQGKGCPKATGKGCPSFEKCNGPQSNLTEEEVVIFKNAKEKFFNDTEALRTQISEKYQAMNEEMIQENPDNAKLIQLQKELSELKADFDQKALSHRLEIRKLLPNATLRQLSCCGQCR